MLTRSSSVHDAFFSSGVNEVTGGINKQYNNFYSFFTLKEINRQLTEENAKLRDSLRSSYLVNNTSRKLLGDTTVKDSSGHIRKFTFLPAQVVGNTVTSQTNYLTLERGSSQGVKKGMSVICPNGEPGSIVGTVIDVSSNFCRVMSILHRNSKVSAMLLKDNSAGSIEWDGADPSYLVLRNIPKSAKVAKGDSVVTSNYSANYPPHVMIGTVTSIAADQASNFFTIKVRTATNFFTLQNVYIVENIHFTEQTKIENASQKNNE